MKKIVHTPRTMLAAAVHAATSSVYTSSFMWCPVHSNSLQALGVDVVGLGCERVGVGGAQLLVKM